MDGLWSIRYWRYAKCPRCYRMELSTWSEQHYVPRTRVIFLLRLGATPYRCEFCRLNFVSFRACKERFSWRKRRRSGEAPSEPVPAVWEASQPLTFSRGPADLDG